LHAVALLDDVARFRPNDPSEIVAASFACPVCLRRANEVVLADDDGVAIATCRCMNCKIGWTVMIDSYQYLRVALAPPHGLLVSRATSYPELLARPPGGDDQRLDR
jgi:hypothetical protein